MQRFFAFCLLVLLLGPIALVHGQEQRDTPGIELTSFTWSKATLQALIVTQENQTWWKPYFVDISQRAVDQWNQAFQFFAEKYTDYAYLSSVSIVLSVSNLTLPDYDIYIGFSENIAIENQDALGLTTTIPNRNGSIQKALVDLSSKSGPIDLTVSDQRDVAAHELGHALGLGHSNSSQDLMYPYYDLFSSDNAVSTLDLYGLATTFSWITTSSDSPRDSASNFITLPSSIIYEYAPIENPSPKGIEDNPLVKSIVIFFSSPYMVILAVALIFFLIVVGLVYVGSGRRRHRHRK